MKSQTRTSGLRNGPLLKSSLGLLGTMAVLFSLMALFASSAMGDETGCPGGNPTSRPTSNLVGVGASPAIDGSGKIATYTFTSSNQGGTGGIPGLIEYCVYYPNGADPTVAVNAVPGGAQGFDGTFFEDPPTFEAFGFQRGGGNPSNIPLDGTTRTMGTATWTGGAPTNQVIVLHINDEAECHRLSLNSETCFVRPGNPEEEEPPADNLTASKDAHPSLTRTYKWEIEKDVEQTRAEIAEGKAKFNYTVTVKHDEGTDSGWLVTGEIEVNNPNSGEVTGVDIEDSIDDLGASCEVTGGSNATIPAESSEAFPYECTYSSPPESSSETNTAIVSWDEQTVDGQLLDEGEAEATAGVEWGEADVELVDEEIEVNDSLHGFLGTVSYTDPNPTSLEYSEEFEGVSGTCTKYNNEATFITSDLGEEGSDSKTVEVCVGTDLKAEKTANPAFEKTFEWDIEKKVDETKINIAEGGAATFNYTVEVTHDEGTAGGWVVTGVITVSNPNDWESIDVNVSDAIDDANATCTVEGEEKKEATIPAGESKEFDYECTYSAAPESDSQTNTATVTWDKEAASTPNESVEAEAAVDWAGTEPTIIDGSVEVEDTLGGPLGPVTWDDPSPETFEYEYTFEGDPAGTCTAHNNTATFTTDDTNTTGEASQEVEVCVGADLTASKTASPSFKRKFPWSITKDVDKTQISTTGKNATFKYTIKVTKGAAEDSDWVVTGKIKITNPNDWESIDVNVSDAIDDANATCTVEGETSKEATLLAEESQEFAYECTYSAKPGSGKQTNTATGTWDAEAAFTPSGSASGEAEVDWSVVSPTTEDNCLAKVTDTVKGETTVLDEDVCASAEYKPSVTFPVKSGCVDYTNVAAFETETGKTGEAKKTVRVCGPVDSGALTIGYWQNKNGQKIITDGKETSKVCNSGTWLRQYEPFKDLSATATCKQVADYVTSIIKAANAGGAAMNPMLKAQMLATALDVYFSDPALGGNKIGAPKPLGGQKIDLTKVCKNIPSCTTLENTSAAFGGATSLTVSQILAYAASKSNSGGSVWYGQVKATQELAKDTFDAINNEVAFEP